MDAREAALLTLNACHRQGGWSDGVLKKQLAAAKLDSRMPPWPPSCASACSRTSCCWISTCPSFPTSP